MDNGGMPEQSAIKAWNTLSSQMHPDTVDWNNGGKIAGEFLNKNLWEYFCDESYYHLWAVRLKLETEFGQSFHVHSEEEAKGLCDLLNNCQQKAVEYVPLNKHSLIQFLTGWGINNAAKLGKDMCSKFAYVKSSGNDIITIQNIETVLNILHDTCSKVMIPDISTTAKYIHSMLLKKGNPNA